MNNALVTKRTSCLLCNSKNLILVLPMKPSPIGDAFVSTDQRNRIQPLISLDLYQCQNCGHAQNIDMVNPEELFRNYIFTTGSSDGLIKHFQNYSQEIVNKFGFSQNSLAVEIGSNDGTLLRFFKNLGMQVIGVDPAREIARIARENGIQTIPDFFSAVLAKRILKEQGPAKLIVANNVYAHSDQLSDITEGIAALLDKDGVFVFEVSYLLDIIDNFVFDTIYHEHLSYHSIEPFIHFFRSHGLELFDIEKVVTKGGSMRCFVQKLNGPRKKSFVVDQMLHEEIQRGLHQPEIFQQYAMQISRRKDALDAYIEEAFRKGQRVVGYGASTTVTTLIYQFELEKKLDYLIDDNVKKHGMLSPGCHLEVKPSSVLYADSPDVVIILAWQYSQSIMQKHKQFLEGNGVFVIPLPEFKVVSNKHMVVEC